MVLKQRLINLVGEVRFVGGIGLGWVKMLGARREGGVKGALLFVFRSFDIRIVGRFATCNQRQAQSQARYKTACNATENCQKTTLALLFF